VLAVEGADGNASRALFAFREIELSSAEYRLTGTANGVRSPRYFGLPDRRIQPAGRKNVKQD